MQDASTDVAEHTPTELVLRKGTTRRNELGHYLGATCCYGGEWYWGVDRLHYLEARLEELGALHGSAESGGRIFAPPVLFEKPLPRQREQLPPLEFFLSFRSPYTYLVSEKVVDFAEQIGVELQLRFVLPMVMRSLPIQPSKRSYILQDAAREARRLGVPFGPIADPVGRPVERGYSLLPWAIEQGRGREYCLSFLRHVWSRGVDAGSKRGLRRIVEACDLDWSEALQHLDDGTWREIAEQNRQDLLDLGLWGVPSFRVGEVAVWGQDRLWVLEDEYRRLAAAHSD